jgi:hypothetical protein
MPIWPGVVPDAQPVSGPEIATTETERAVAGKPWIGVGRVSSPTMTVYLPTGKCTGAAVVVFPGGGYRILAIDLEGTEVCDWLISRGIVCVLLKYRVPGSGLSPRSGATARQAVVCALRPPNPTRMQRATREGFIAKYFLRTEISSQPACAAADEMHDFEPVAFFQVCVAPSIAGNDFAVQLDRDAVGLHAKDFNEGRECQ